MRLARAPIILSVAAEGVVEVGAVGKSGSHGRFGGLFGEERVEREKRWGFEFHEGTTAAAIEMLLSSLAFPIPITAKER